MAVFMIMFAWFVFYVPNYLGHPDNYIPANPSVTPTHIVPEWYYLPFYAILRAVPNKLGGVALLGAAIVILAFLPWLDRSKVRSARYRPRYRFFFWLFFICCVALGWLGSKPAEGIYVYAARAATALLLRALPGGPAVARPLRDADPVAGLDHRIRAQARRHGCGHCLRGDARGPRRPVVAKRRGGRRHAAEAEVVVRRTVRQVRSRAAAARLQGLPRGLPDLSRPVAGRVPQSRRSGWPRLHVGAGRRGRRRISGAGRSRRPGRGQGPSGPSGRPFPAAVQEREPGARALQRRAARSLGDRQGARL